MQGTVVAGFFDSLLEAMEREQPEIDRLDAVAGDGDCGSTMVLGLRTVVAEIPRSQDAAPAEVLRVAAARFATVGGSAGPLWGTGLLRAARELERRGDLDLAACAAAAIAATEGMAQRGRSREGERTVLDVMGPAARALAAAAEAGQPAGEALAAALASAEDGCERTRTLAPRQGRDQRAPERVRGHVDAGAAAALVCWQVAATPPPAGPPPA
jgi:dihydroxyacetone kinase-like protein